jgi:methionyl-tRNA formyltransferase
VDSQLRLVFMGTPEFAVPSLEALMHLGAISGCATRVVGVFTQPDRPAGRGQRVSVSPVKAAAASAAIPVFQPAKLRRPDAFALLASLEPDLIVVAAYAQILSRSVLDLPRFGCLNVHGSLLPKYRGASPIQAAILDGAEATGISIMLMDEGLDTGPVLAQVETHIHQRDTSATLSDKLAVLGARLLAATIPRWVEGAITPQPQDAEHASISQRLRKTDGEIDWSKPAEHIVLQVRAMNPWPGAYSFLDDTLLKVIEARATPYEARPERLGTVVQTGNGPAVSAGDGVVVLDTVQPAGKRPMSGADWLRGAPRALGSVLHGGVAAVSQS